MNNKILITGSNGFTGTYLTKALEQTQWEVIPLSQYSSGLKNEIVIDFCDDAFSGFLRTLPPVIAVVHLGTRVGWDKSTSADLFKPNVLATGILADWAKRNNSFFIFASAALIAGETTTHITPGLPVNTTNDYLYSKWLAEELIRMSGVRHSLLRISGIYGFNGPQHLGLNKAIKNAVDGIPPVQYGTGNIKRNYVYVKDLCKTILYAIEHQEKTQGTHLIASPEPISIKEMLQTICDILLPGSHPEVKEGTGGYDQIIEPSPIFPPVRSFSDAINDIYKDIHK